MTVLVGVDIVVSLCELHERHASAARGFEDYSYVDTRFDLFCCCKLIIFRPYSTLAMLLKLSLQPEHSFRFEPLLRSKAY